MSYCSPKSAAEGNLSTALIGLPRLIGSHTGSNIARLIADVIIKYHIEENIGAFMMDNAKDNDKLMETIATIFPTIDPKWARLRCAGHIINLIVQAALFGKGVSKLQKQIAGAGADDIFRIWSKTGPIGRAKTITVYIGRTDQRRMAFRNCQTDCKEGDEEVFYLELLKDGGVRWNAVYTMIKRGTFECNCFLLGGALYRVRSLPNILLNFYHSLPPYYIVKLPSARVDTAYSLPLRR